jgi:hypothetical protein
VTGRTPDILFEYARDRHVSMEVAREHFEFYFQSDEQAVRNHLDHWRQVRRDHKLLDNVAPSPAYDGAVLRALHDLGRPVRVGELAELLKKRFPVVGDRTRVRSMWTGPRLARACQRLVDEHLATANPIQTGAGPTQVALAYALTDKGRDRAAELKPGDPRPAEWRP